MKFLLFLIISIGLTGCFYQEEKYSKGFQVSEITEDKEGNKIVGLPIDSLRFEVRPYSVLATHFSKYRLIPLFKVNYNSKGESYTGNIYHHVGNNNDDAYQEIVNNQGDFIRVKKQNPKNIWNQHFIPGFSAVYGYNIVNVSVFDTEMHSQKELFDRPVLIKTIYFPSEIQDILNYKPITRNYYMISVYDEDTNKDGYINSKDLRRFYAYDLEGNTPKILIPKNYSVISSEYDPYNDFMYIYANYDANNNGKIDKKEPYSIHWIDLKNPENKGIIVQK